MQIIGTKKEIITITYKNQDHALRGQWLTIHVMDKGKHASS